MAITGIAATLFASGSVSAADGGTISFTGAIVAPSFSINSANVTGSPQAFTVEHKPRGNDTATPAATVTFAAAPSSPPSADISLALLNHARVGQSVLANFADGAGRRVVPGADGAYYVGASGGVLSLNARTGVGAAKDTAVIVMTSYN